HCQPVVDDLTARTKAYHHSQKIPFSSRDEEYFRLEVVGSLIKALGAYLKPSDHVDGISVSSHHGNVDIRCTVERDGKKSHFHTYTIVAGGEIQRDHLRYLVDTPLSKISVGNSLLSGLKEVKKKMSLQDR